MCFAIAFRTKILFSNNSIENIFGCNTFTIPCQLSALSSKTSAGNFENDKSKFSSIAFSINPNKIILKKSPSSRFKPSLSNLRVISGFKLLSEKTLVIKVLFPDPICPPNNSGVSIVLSFSQAVIFFTLSLKHDT